MVVPKGGVTSRNYVQDGISSGIIGAIMVPKCVKWGNMVGWLSQKVDYSCCGTNYVEFIMRFICGFGDFRDADICKHGLDYLFCEY